MNNYERSNLAKKAAFQAERLRTRYNINSAASIDIINFSQTNGVEVWLKSLSSLEGCYSPSPRPTIILGSMRPAGRRNFTCAHELGHHIFNHGMNVEELNNQKKIIEKQPNEFIADMFASYLLMPQLAIRRFIKAHSFDMTKLNPIQVMYLSSYFGVGFTTMLNHLTWTLNILTHQEYNRLIKFKLKDLKNEFNTRSENELLFVNNYWNFRSIDLEIDDTFCMTTLIEFDEKYFQLEKKESNHFIYRANKIGLTRIKSSSNDWFVNVRISLKNYNGLAIYRYLEDETEE